MSEDFTFPSYFEKLLCSDNEIYASKIDQFEQFSKPEKDLPSLDWIRNNTDMDIDHSSLYEYGPRYQKKDKKRKRDSKTQRDTIYINAGTGPETQTQPYITNTFTQSNIFKITEIQNFNNNFSLTLYSDSLMDKFISNKDQPCKVFENIKNFFSQKESLLQSLTQDRLKSGSFSSTRKSSSKEQVFMIEKIDRKFSSDPNHSRKESSHNFGPGTTQNPNNECYETNMDKSDIISKNNNNSSSMNQCLKLLKNRLSAKKSRQKKKIYITELEEKCKAIQNELEKAKQLLTKRNSGLESKIEKVC